MFPLLQTSFARNWNDNLEDHLVNMNKYREEFLIWNYEMCYVNKTNAAYCNNTTSIARTKALLYTLLRGNVIRNTMELNKHGNWRRLTKKNYLKLASKHKPNGLELN
jgi:hypothetical protein